MPRTLQETHLKIIHILSSEKPQTWDELVRLMEKAHVELQGAEYEARSKKSLEMRNRA